jgi:uncharacterized membrane protein
MKKTTLLTYLLAAAPTYFSCFAGTVYAVMIMAIATVIGIGLSGSVDTDDKDLTDKLRDAWIIHIIGTFIVTLIHNT